MYLQHIREIKAIDTHCHLGSANPNSPKEYWGSELFGDADLAVENMKRANIGISVPSSLESLMPRGYGDAVLGNKIILDTIEKMDAPVYMLAVINPLQKESYAQAAELLQHPKCVGLKVHPEEHMYPILNYGGEIYEFAGKHNALIITHSGEINSLPEDFCFFANRFPEVNTVVSHLGCGYDGRLDHQIVAIEENTQNNLYTDTSSFKTLLCEVLERAVARIGSEKILFGTDSGCYFSPAHRARVDCAHISDEDKYNILYRNALKLLPMLKPVYEQL